MRVLAVFQRRHWLLASGSLAGSWLEEQSFSFKGMCLCGGHWLLASGTTFVCTVDDVDAKYVDTGALGGRITCTVNVTIRLMGPMVILALPCSSQSMKRRVELFKPAILMSDIDGTK